MNRDIPAVEYWVDSHLQTWARSMSGDNLPRGCPRQACVGENYSSLDLDNVAAYEHLDADIARRTGAVIDDIGIRHPAQKAAIYRAYGVAAVFRFPRENYAQILDAAKENVKLGLRKRGVWLGE